MSPNAKRDGFSLVEVIVAMVILAVGVLAMGASTGYIMTQIRVGELRSERMTAVRHAAETLRGEPWANLETVCGNQLFSTSRYDVSCTVVREGNDLKRLDLVSVGPGFDSGHIRGSIADTFSISLARPQ